MFIKFLDGKDHQTLWECDKFHVQHEEKRECFTVLIERLGYDPREVCFDKNSPNTAVYVMNNEGKTIDIILNNRGRA